MDFPILGSNDSIPWDVIAPHEKQALKNHGQTLKRLAERRGLDWTEAQAVLEDRDWKSLNISLSRVVVLKLVSDFQQHN